MIKELVPIFTEYIPENLEEGNLYISDKYQTSIHLCCCGCGNQVVVTDQWKILVDDDKKVTISPSIGNWNFPCKSHYFICKNKVVWL